MPIEGRTEPVNRFPESKVESGVDDTERAEQGTGTSNPAINIKLQPDRWTEPGEEIEIHLYRGDPGCVKEQLLTSSERKPKTVMNFYADQVGEIELPFGSMQLAINQNFGWGNLIALVHGDRENHEITIMELHSSML